MGRNAFQHGRNVNFNDVNLTDVNVTSGPASVISTTATPLLFEKYKDAWPFVPFFFGLGLLMVVRGMYLAVEMKKIDRDEELEHVDLERDI